MKYTLEDIYVLVGREDKVAGITLRTNSDSWKLYGEHINVVFIYSQDERELLDLEILEQPSSHHGYVKARGLGELKDEQKEILKTKGINSEDIVEILYSVAQEENTFHSKETRKIKKLTVNLNLLPKGQDLDWMYGFKKKLVADNVGLCPRERQFYLACKYYYEPDKLTQEELNEVFVKDDVMDEAIEHQLLGLKYIREELSNEEQNKLIKYFRAKEKFTASILNQYLNQAGSSLKKLVATNPEQAVYLYEKALNFKDRRLNVTGRTPIYIDIDSFLHIYMRHVEEFKVTEHFEDKDNFQWNADDILTVMEHVIRQYNDEIQDFFANGPGKRYSRYGNQSAYFEGDYYTFHITPSGRISTFHKNKK